MALAAALKSQDTQRALQAAFIEHMESVYQNNAEISRLQGEDEMQHIAISASLSLSTALEMACMKMQEKAYRLMQTYWRLSLGCRLTQ
ncbi:hypothetical protein JCM19237_300 [Photobacterium aphoticum]|uniref:Uncharacterized protein n=1 Tax=Photobacterium aphoticum TaxID=754436 RepID=A0A090QXJ1_9GAMM|nr:hypothetical protein JCM19237_300 [Photobacterium aphoticum]